MKKTLSKTIALLLMLMMVLTSGLVAYAEEGTGSVSPEPHVHSFGEWQVTAQPTYVFEGTQVRYCSCGFYETQAIPRILVYNTWVSEGGNLYYMDGNGNPYLGWHKMKPYGEKKVKWCYFARNGVFTKSIKKTTKNKWVNAGGYRFYFNKKKKPVGPGFNLIKKKMYYMDEFGAVIYGTFVASDGMTYTTNKNGTISGLAFFRQRYKTFVLIDISDQTLWYYKGGTLKLKADVVTGTKGKTGTPTGTFKVRSKQRNITLSGPTWNAKVSYWIAFKGSAYGMHDASWRSSKEFSNHKTYLKNGSHGCVNMRYKDAKELYGMVKKGTKVIVQQ